MCDNVLLPKLKSEFIQTNYAGQKNKGTLYGLDCLSAQMQLAYYKYGYNCWIVKGDIRKYFYSINHAILKDIVRFFIEDNDLYWLCEKFIDSTNEEVGLPLGNQISQVFALLYLSGLDRFVTGELGVKYYGRYVFAKIEETYDDDTDIEIYDMHNIVESVLEEDFPLVAKMYKEYRNYKKDFVHMMDNVYEKSQAIRYIGDKSNANTDSALVATKRSLIYNELSSELYKKFFLTHAEKQAMKDGYIYIHDRSARLDTFNCDLFRVGNVMSGGFEMGNIWYNEPNTLDTAFDVMGDIILSTAAQQYGGFTVPEVDKILEPYAEKSYKKYISEYREITDSVRTKMLGMEIYDIDKSADEYAIKKVSRDFDQGWQGIEMKLNSVGSSRGDYPFVTMTLGLATSRFGKMAAISLLNVHSGGQGKKGFKRPVLFPKIVFLYDKNLHGDGSEKYQSADVFNAGLDCSSKTMYPDWLSLTGDGYVAEMYKKYGRVVSPMGKCKSAHVKRYLTVA